MRRLLKIWGLTLCCALAGAPPAARANFVVNGSFEAVQIGSPYFSTNPADIPGWTHAGTVGDALLWAVGYQDGSGNVTVAGQGKQFVTMGGGFFGSGTGSWSQTLTGLTPGSAYSLAFDMASEGLFSGSQSITVGFPSGSATPGATFTAGPSSGNYWRNWEEKTMNFVASNSSVTLRFSATTQFDVGLDDVRVEVATVPEPGSLTLLALGAAGLIGHRLRRRKALA